MSSAQRGIKRKEMVWAMGAKPELSTLMQGLMGVFPVLKVHGPGIPGTMRLGWAYEYPVV